MDNKELLEQRGAIYGDIRDNMNCAHELLRVLEKYSSMNRRAPTTLFQVLGSRDYIGHQGCLIMICHKLARIVTGAAIHADNYDDIGGYATLARDIAIRAKEEKNDTSQAMSEQLSGKDEPIRSKYPGNITVSPTGGYNE